MQRHVARVHTKSRMVAPYDSCTKLAEEVSEKELSKPNYIWYGQRYSQYREIFKSQLEIDETVA